MTLGQAYFWGTSLALALLLYFPVSKLIWVTRVRKLEKRQQRTTTEEERQKEKKVARLITIVLVVAFALLFNRNLLS